MGEEAGVGVSAHPDIGVIRATKYPWIGSVMWMELVWRKPGRNSRVPRW